LIGMLECWNTGRLGLEYWGNGEMGDWGNGRMGELQVCMDAWMHEVIG
jgi:hypothetical protein